MKIAELRRRSNNFINDLPHIIVDILIGNQPLLDLNRSQLDASMLATGSNITPQYSPGYAEWKARNYPQSYGDGRVNLLLTGEFRDSMQFNYNDNTGEYYITSFAEHMSELVGKYGEDIFGITLANQPTAKSITNENISKEYKRRVFGR